MSAAGKKLIKAATEAVAVAKGKKPAARLTVNGHHYVPASKPKKQTSPAISSIAGRYARMTNAELDAIVFTVRPSTRERYGLYRDIRKLAASCLSQDVTKGQK